MATKKGTSQTSDDVDIQKIVDASIKAGLIRGDTTIKEVVDFVRTNKITRVGYVVAWEKWVAVIKPDKTTTQA